MEKEVTRLVDPTAVPEVQTEDSPSAAFHPQEVTTVEDVGEVERSLGDPVREPGSAPDTVEPRDQPEVAVEPPVFTDAPEGERTQPDEGLSGLPHTSDEFREQTPEPE